MSDVDDILRSHTTEPYVVIQVGEFIPTTEGGHMPALMSFGNGMTMITAEDLILQMADGIRRGEAHIMCSDPECDKHGESRISREEMLHARREPPYGG